MERKVLIVCGFVGFLGLLSAATGFGAEATRIKVRKNRNKKVLIFHFGGLDLGFVIWVCFKLLFLVVFLVSSSSFEDLITNPCLVAVKTEGKERKLFYFVG